MLRFSLFGIPVRVQPWFWLVLALIGGGVGANSREDIINLIWFILAGFISIMVHELGHALAGRRFGARCAITLHPMGGLTEFQGAWFTRPQSFLVTAAGPLLQIMLGLAAYAALPHLNRLHLPPPYFVAALIWISIVWAVLNLVPILPLDGGQLLHAVLGPQRLRLTLWISVVTAFGLTLLTLTTTKLLILPILLGYFGWQAFRQLKEIP